MSTKPKSTISDKLNKLKASAKETHEMFVTQTQTFEEFMDEEDIEWKNALENELRRIRKALKKEVKIKNKDGTYRMMPRPNDLSYLEKINKRLTRVSKDMDELFSDYLLSDESSGGD